MPSFSEKTEALCRRVEGNNTWRQKDCFNLIPSESTPSLLVKMCEISDPGGRYAEHRTMKGEEVYFYQGIDFIREVEVEAQRELARFFGCTDMELRPVSGQMANEVVFKGVVKFLNRGRAAGQASRRMRLVLNNELGNGGHLSAQPMGALFNFIEEDPATGKENVVNFPVRKDNPYKADLNALAALLETHKPELVIFGKSMFISREPVRFVADIVRDWPQRPVLMFDMAHVLGLYGAFQEPFAEGADIVTGSTHKTFFGPQRGRGRGQPGQGRPAAPALGRHPLAGLPRLDLQPPPGHPPRPAHGHVRDERLQDRASRPRSAATPRAWPSPCWPTACRSRATRPTATPRPTRSWPGSRPSAPAWTSPAAWKTTTSSSTTRPCPTTRPSSTPPASGSGFRK